jgi:ribosomal protein S18 acetylase RimI-like enzyme
MTERARLAAEADLDAVEAIAATVVADMVDARGGALFLTLESGKGTVRERFGRAVALDDQIAIVGCFDDVVFGFVLATIEVLPDGTRLGSIEALTVAPEARGVGIGEAMMNLVLGELRAAGCVGVDSRALPGDRETKNFFESFGLKARLLTVHQRFDDGDPGTDADGTVPPA